MSISRWMDTQATVHQRIEYYSALKRNELSSHEKSWRTLKCILLTERNQSEKVIYCLILDIDDIDIWHSWKAKTMETVKSGDQGLGWEKGCIDRAQRILRAVKILWYYNDGYMALYACSFTKLFLTLCNPRDCGPTGSSVHGIS